MNPGDILYRKESELPSHTFWRIAVSNDSVLRFAFIEPNRFLYSKRNGAILMARLPSARLVKDPTKYRREMIEAIFRASIFEEHKSF